VEAKIMEFIIETKFERKYKMGDEDENKLLPWGNEDWKNLQRSQFQLLLLLIVIKKSESFQ